MKFDQDLEGLVYEGQDIAYLPGKITIIPHFYEAGLVEAEEILKAKGQRLASMPEVYMALKHGKLQISDNSPCFTSSKIHYNIELANAQVYHYGTQFRTVQIPFFGPKILDSEAAKIWPLEYFLQMSCATNDNIGEIKGNFQKVSPGALIELWTTTQNDQNLRPISIGIESDHIAMGTRYTGSSALYFYGVRL